MTSYISSYIATYIYIVDYVPIELLANTYKIRNRLIKPTDESR